MPKLMYTEEYIINEELEINDNIEDNVPDNLESLILQDDKEFYENNDKDFIDTINENNLSLTSSK